MLLRTTPLAREPFVTFQEIPKSGGGVRLLARLSPALDVTYRNAVAVVVPSIERSLSAAVVSERISVEEGADGSARLVGYPLTWAWTRCRLRARRLRTVASGPMVLADVRSCYASIAPVVVERRLRELRCDAAREIRALLELMGEHGVEGLPVGPRASAVLANAVLGRVDCAIARAGARHLRWVDDLAILPGRGASASFLDRLAEALASVGLSLAREKCAVGDLSATRFGRSLWEPPSVPRPGGSLG